MQTDLCCYSASSVCVILRYSNSIARCFINRVWVCYSLIIPSFFMLSFTGWSCILFFYAVFFTSENCLWVIDNPEVWVTEVRLYTEIMFPLSLVILWILLIIFRFICADLNVKNLHNCTKVSCININVIKCFPQNL